MGTTQRTEDRNDYWKKLKTVIAEQKRIQFGGNILDPVTLDSLSLRKRKNTPLSVAESLKAQKNIGLGIPRI